MKHRPTGDEKSVGEGKFQESSRVRQLEGERWVAEPRPDTIFGHGKESRENHVRFANDRHHLDTEQKPPSPSSPPPSSPLPFPFLPMKKKSKMTAEIITQSRFGNRRCRFGCRNPTVIFGQPLPRFLLLANETADRKIDGENRTTRVRQPFGDRLRKPIALKMTSGKARH